MLGNFVPKSHSQLDLFGAHDEADDDLIMESIDKVNASHGRHTLKYAACGIYQDWKMM